MDTIGNRIKVLRQSKGLTQAELAQILGVPYQSVGQWERGIRKPKPATITQIADALGVPVSEIFGIDHTAIADTAASWKIAGSNLAAFLSAIMIDDNGKTSTISSDRTRLNAAFDKLNEAGQQKAVDYVEDLAGNEKYRKPAEDVAEPDTPTSDPDEKPDKE